MKVKIFILSLLLTMFCSTSFGQHWGEIPNDCEDNMTFVTQIFINGELQGNNIEIGAFCGNEFRGSARPITDQANLVYLLIGGDTDHNGDQISFKLARHYADGTSEELDYVVLNAVQYDNNARIGGSPSELVNGLLPEDDRTEFNSVAELNGKVYPSLANALAACTSVNNIIKLLADNAENVTIKQVEGVNITIDGGTSRYDYSGTITIHGNARHDGDETLTFKNIDFTTDKAGHYFIDSNSTDSDERYAHNVTVDDCNFTATGAGINSAVAMRIRQGYNIAINGGEFNGLHSVLQAYGNAGINITDITSNCKNGISVGSSTNVVIKGSYITATGYGVRVGDGDSNGGTVNGPLTITDTEINAFIPVSVRGVNDATDCEFNFTGNTMYASNTDGYWCVIGTTEYEANGSLPETAGKIIVNATEADLLGVYGYSRVEVTFADSTTKYFYMMEGAVPYNNADNYEGATIKLLSNCAGRGLRFWENGMTFDLNGKKYTITQAVGSSGTESQGFQIRPEVTGNVTIKNGTIDIKAGTNVKWMFNSYAADFVVKDVTIDGTNMVTNTSEDYLLVVQNAGDKATFENVTIQNYDAKKVYLEGNTTFVAPQEFDNIEIPTGYVLVYENGAYIVRAGNVLNANTGAKYATLAEAITAATAGDKLVLLADITENVTVNKNLTIDGANAEAVGGKFNYTGTMTANNGLTVTVQNIDFVGGGFDKSSKSTTGNYTIKNCTFEDDGDYAYPVRIKGASSVTIEDCTVKNYMYSFLYITSSTNSVSVKNVTVEDCPNYAVYFASGVNTATIENLTVKNSNNGFVINNTANRALTLKNCKLENVNNAIHSSGTNTITCTLLGNENNFGTSATSQYAKYVLAEADATLTAPEGFNVTTTVANHEVDYENGVYFVLALSGSGTEEDPFMITNLDELIIFRDHVNAGKTKYNADGVYVALGADIDMAAVDWSVNIGDDCNYTFDGIFDGKGNTLSNLKSTETAQKADGYVCTGLFGAIYGNAVVKNLTIENVNINTGDFTGNNVAAVVGFVYGVSGKTVTIDGVNVTGDINICASGVYGVGAIVGYSYNQGTLNIKSCAVEANDESAITAASGSGAIIGYCGGKATIDACSVQNINITAKGLVGGIAGITENSVNKVLSGNTVKDVTLAVTKPEWVNSTAIAVGTMDGNGLTVSGTTYENVNAGRMVGSVYAEQPTYIVPAVQARIGDKYYGTLQTAINTAVDNDVIVVLADITVDKDDVNTLDGSLNTFFLVENKTITIDLNGYTIIGDVTGVGKTGNVGLVGLFSIDGTGNLTLNDGKYSAVVKIENATDTDPVYALISCYNGNDSKLTINGGSYQLNAAQDCLVHSAGDNTVVVNDGNFRLDNVGTDVNVNNGQPWIFNANGKSEQSVLVNGGIYNYDVNHQYWAHEVNVPETLALNDNGDGTWTVVPAVAQGTDRWRGYDRSLGYASIADAAYWATAETTVKVVADHAATVPAVVERNLTLNMNAKAVTAQDIYPVIRIQNGASLTVTGEGSITNNDYVFVLGASDGSSAGDLTIESGTFHGATTVASVTKGNLNITGGDFSVDSYQGSYEFLINCIDTNYNDGTAKVSISGGTFHNWNPENNAAEGAGTNFCAPGYGAVENPTDVWTVVPKQTTEVKDGWNWFSYYVEGDVLDQLQNSLGEDGVQIKSRTQFTQYANGNWSGSLVSTTPAESYKINVDADAVINVTGNIVNPSTCDIELNNGDGNGAWNWIGYPLAQETSVATAFAGVVKNGDQVKTRTGFAEYVNDQWWGLLMTLKPGVGYMYYRAGANETVSNFTYPTPSSKEAVQPNITADANLWVPNSTSYANNMTMVAVLNMNGEMMNDNYEVAAMVNGEVRGSARPIYVEPMDAYMLFLTIHGEGVEEVTFQCYDFNTDTEYVLNNTINYSDDARLGSVNEPYVLCYGTMGIGENAMNTINIYPNPTTTGREINLGATCDKVEVYNALGVKVAEYQDVDTLDAIETAGIYVIRVTNDGDVKHCRLVVK